MLDRVLITGGSGLLALNWALTTRNKYAVTLGLHARRVAMPGTESRQLDLESVDALVGTMSEIQPAFVVHAAGMTSVEGCELRPDLAYHINVTLSANVAEACARLSIPLVHISTDHLFSGGELLLGEAHIPEPINAYARTKAAAECRVLAVHPSALVIRTNFYGWGPNYRQSFSDLIIAALRSGHELNLFTDVYYTPVLIETMAVAVHDLLRLKVNGVFHVVGDERLSKYDFGIRVANEFDLDSGLIKPAILARQRMLVRRPLEMSLSNQKVCNLIGRKFGSVTEHLARLHEQEHEGLATEVQKL